MLGLPELLTGLCCAISVASASSVGLNKRLQMHAPQGHKLKDVGISTVTLLFLPQVELVCTADQASLATHSWAEG